MRNIAIICEYNPMHNGHIYQIKKIKEEFPNSNIIILMSSSFVQRGEPSILNKFDKAEIAIKNGVDLVLEMPTIISLQSADFFAHYSVKILNMLKIVDYISFGIEDDIKVFKKIYKEIQENKLLIDELIKTGINNGFSYKKSFINALDKLNINSSLFEKPNNTLAFQYISSLKKLNSNIKIFPIKRCDGGYNKKEIDNFEFQSATTLRNLIIKNEDISHFVPIEVLKKISNYKFYNLNNYSNIFYYTANIEKRCPKNIAGYENGMLNLINKNFKNSLSESIELSHNKRYSISRLKRFIFNYLLNITNEDIKKLNNLSYIRPLAFNKNGTQILKAIKENSKIEIINNIANLKDNIFIEIDKKAYILHNICCKEKISLDYTYMPFQKY